MPHRKSALKALKQNQKRRLRNKVVRTRLRTEQNKLTRMLERGDVEDAKKQVAQLTKLLHRAASKKVIHTNNAARQQANLQKRLNDAETAGA